MMQFVGALLIGLAALLALRTGRAQSTHNDPRRVAALGDSITANLGRSGGYLDLVLAALPQGSAVQKFGYGGQGVDVISQHVNEVLAWRPTDVIVLAGVNDLASHRSEERIAARLAEIYGRFRAAGVRVIAVQVLPWGRRPTYDAEGTWRLNHWILAQEELRQVARVVRTDLMGDANGWLLPAYTKDGVHLTKAGNDALGQLIWQQAFP